jgi:hypothetical protein
MYTASIIPLTVHLRKPPALLSILYRLYANDKQAK